MVRYSEVDRASSDILLGRRLFVGAIALLVVRPVLAWDFGTVRSTFTTVIRKKHDGPVVSEWRSSDHRNFTIIGMNPDGGHDDFRIAFTLVHERKVTCELAIEKSESDPASFAVWLGPRDAPFVPDDVTAGILADAGVQRASLERVLPPGSYRAEGLWRGRRGSEIVGRDGEAMLTVTIHGVG